MIEINTTSGYQELKKIIDMLGFQSEKQSTISLKVLASPNQLENEVGILVKDQKLYISFFDPVDIDFRWWATFEDSVSEDMLHNTIITASTNQAIETRIAEMSRATELEHLLTVALGEFVKVHDLGWLWQGWMRFKNVDDVITTIFIPKERLVSEPVDDEVNEFAPDLVIKSVHPNNSYHWADRDKTISQLFQIGVKEIWTILSREQSIIVYHSPSDFITLHPGDVLMGKGSLEGFKYEVTRLMNSKQQFVRGYSLVRIQPKGYRPRKTG